MRESYFNKALINGDSGEVVGISFGYDYCAEHEWGIKRLKRSLGVNDTAEHGVARRKINPENVKELAEGGFLGWYEDKDICGIYLFRYQRDNLDVKENTRICFQKDVKIHSAWDEGSFAFFLGKGNNTKEELIGLRGLYDSILAGDAVILITSDFMGSGLTIHQASKLPSEVVSKWTQGDKDKKSLDEYVRESGILEELRAAGCEYFACSPRYDHDGKVIFWLNPQKQDDNNYGWFTLEELRQWCKGKGPIPKRR